MTMTKSITFLLFLFIAGFTYALTPEEILQKADDIRNPQQSFFMLVKVEDQKENKFSEFEVYTKGKDHTLIKTLGPVRDKGRNLLMIEENMWAFIPNLKRSIRVSLSQKLTGQAANGDISRMRWAGDYEVKQLDDEEGNFQLFLTAKEGKKGLTYNKIRVLIEKETFRPTKAYYLSTTGKVLKEAEFGNYQEMAGSTRPSTITIKSATDKSDISLITIREMTIKNIPQSFFSEGNLQ